MPSDVAHFAIHADDCDRARTFYESVFGWTFEPWGPPGFWRIHTSPGAIEGALHARHDPVTGSGMTGFQCTISVDDIEAAVVAVKQHGGVLKHEPFLIETVGTVLTFTDTEGNVVSVMQYL